MPQQDLLYLPDFSSKCRICEASPTVIVSNLGIAGGHTEVCGPCFFDDASMWDEEEWNREKESTE